LIEGNGPIGLIKGEVGGGISDEWIMNGGLGDKWRTKLGCYHRDNDGY